jgi:hypothetical protein
MKRSVIIPIVILLAATTAWLSYFRNHSTLGTSSNALSLTRPERVSQVRISDGNDTLILERSGEKWMIDDDIAQGKKVADLLLLSQQLKIISPAPLSISDSLGYLIEQGTRIHFLSGTSTMLDYTICKYNRQIFARKTNSRKIFRVAPLGFSGVDPTQVLITSKKYWLGNLLIDLGPEEIRLVNIRYFQMDMNDFTLFSGEGKIALKIKDIETDSSGIDHGQVKNYLNFFTDIGFEEPENIPQLLEAVKDQLPFFTLQIIGSETEETSLAGFRIPGGDSQEFNPFRFCGITRENQCVILKYSDFDPILAHPEEFLKK